MMTNIIVVTKKFSLSNWFTQCKQTILLAKKLTAHFLSVCLLIDDKNQPIRAREIRKLL